MFKKGDVLHLLADTQCWTWHGSVEYGGVWRDSIGSKDDIVVYMGRATHYGKLTHPSRHYNWHFVYHSVIGPCLIGTATASKCKN